MKILTLSLWLSGLWFVICVTIHGVRNPHKVKATPPPESTGEWQVFFERPHLTSAHEEFITAIEELDKVNRHLMGVVGKEDHLSFKTYKNRG